MLSLHSTAFFVLLALCPMAMAVFCRTGVDSVNGPVVDCSLNQCVNTSSPEAIVYSCDYSRICDMIQLRDSCVQEGDNIVCCCSSDECNSGSMAPRAFVRAPGALHLDGVSHDLQPLY